MDPIGNYDSESITEELRGAPRVTLEMEAVYAWCLLDLLKTVVGAREAQGPGASRMCRTYRELGRSLQRQLPHSLGRAAAWPEDLSLSKGGE